MKNLDLQKLIFENYLYIVSGLVLGVIIVGSYKYYNLTIEEKSAKAGDLYEILSKSTDDEEIYNISEKIIEEYNDTVYSIFTRLYLAKHYHDKNDYQKAQTHLSFIIENDFNKNYKELAKIRLSRVYISQDNYKKALEYQDKLLPLHRAAFAEPSPAPTKYALSLLSKCENEVRAPLCTISTETESQIKSAMHTAGLISASDE